MDPIDSRLIQTFVLLHRQYDLAMRVIAVQGRIVEEIEESLSAETQRYEQALDLQNYVFALVDHLVRFQKIALSLPRFNYRSPEYTAFVAAMGDLKEIRNQFQHINNDAENSFQGPLLGAICWGRGDRQFVVTMHDIGRERSSSLVAYDRKEGGFPEHLRFIYNDRDHDLVAACNAMTALWDWIAKRVFLKVDGKDFAPIDHTAILSIRITPVDDGAQSESRPSDS